MGFYYINEEQKIRIALSEKAKNTMAHDMSIFSVPKSATFINTVFANYRDDAKISISSYLQRKESELYETLDDTKLDDASKETAIKKLLAKEEDAIKNKINEIKAIKTKSKLYHLNNKNKNYLINEFSDEDADTFGRPSLYLKCIMEEYCSLPFIKRERIYKKQVYETVETACKEKKILKINALYQEKNQLFYVYPYKIVSDPFDTQSYLACYSWKKGESAKNKTIASFSMARLNMPTMSSKSHFRLTKEEIAKIEKRITDGFSAYLLGEPEEIHVRLTENGKSAYQIRLYSRPDKDDERSTENEYVFKCSQEQIFNYFFPFGADAEIISPESLRERMYNTYSDALERYRKK